MSFLQGSIDLFTGKRSSHMGAYQYADHSGTRNGKNMSGAKLWAEIEAGEINATETNLFSAEERLIRTIGREIGDHFPFHSSILEMGTGTPNAFKKKTLLIMMALRSTEYICVDESAEFLNILSTDKALASFKVHPILSNFFEGDELYFDKPNKDALICMFGSTIGNIISPLSEKAPKQALIEHLSTIAKSISKGGLLVSFDTDTDGKKVKDFYNRQEAFQLNTFFRMEAELPISGDFDPNGFTYQANWIQSSGTLAHMAVASRDMTFTIGGKELSLAAGQSLHMKNSFKYSKSFFEECASEAGLEVIEKWQDDSPTCMFLLNVPEQAAEIGSIQDMVPTWAPANNSEPEAYTKIAV